MQVPPPLLVVTGAPTCPETRQYSEVKATVALVLSRSLPGACFAFKDQPLPYGPDAEVGCGGQVLKRGRELALPLQVPELSPNTAGETSSP